MSDTKKPKSPAGLGAKTARHKPNGDVTVAQLNHMLRECEAPRAGARYARSEQEFKQLQAESALEQQRIEPLHSLLREVMAPYFSLEDMEQLGSQTIAIRHGMAQAMQRALVSSHDGVQAYPESWDEMHERGLQGQAHYQQALMDRGLPEDQAKTLGTCFGRLWFMLEQRAYGGTAQKHTSRTSARMTAAQLNAMLHYNLDAMQQVLHDKLGATLCDDATTDKQYKIDFIGTQIGRYINALLDNSAGIGHSPETWPELQALLDARRAEFIHYLEAQSQEWDINLVGHQKEIEAAYRAVEQHMLHAGRHAVDLTPRFRMQ